MAFALIKTEGFDESALAREAQAMALLPSPPGGRIRRTAPSTSPATPGADDRRVERHSHRETEAEQPDDAVVPEYEATEDHDGARRLEG